MNNNNIHPQSSVTRQGGALVRLPARRAAAAATLALGSLMLAGCATGPDANPRDPLEPYNRTVTDFNDGVDRAVLKPVATAYREVMPSPVRTGVSNFFANLGDIWSFVNNVLQFRGSEAMDSLVRFNVNTVFGLGGVLDIASEMGIPRRKTDFGLTLGRWGVPTGPYLVLPLLGPSTVRDTVALPVDVQGNPLRDLTWCPRATSSTCCAWWTSAPACWPRATCWTRPRSTSTASRATCSCGCAAWRWTPRPTTARTTTPATTPMPASCRRCPTERPGRA